MNNELLEIQGEIMAFAIKKLESIGIYNPEFNEQLNNLFEKMDLVKDSVRRCYYNDDKCSGEIVNVSGHKKYLCTKCKEEEDTVPDDYDGQL